MCRERAGWWLRIAVVLVLGSGVAHAKKPVVVDRWEAVEALMPGTEISVSPGSQGSPDVCRVSAVDSSALTCVAEDGRSDGQLVFARGAVKDVWVFETAPSRHIVLWIAAVATVGLEISSCISAGFFGCAIVGAALAVMWGSAAIVAPLGAALGQLWPQRPPRLRKRLVYEVPVTP